MNPKSFPIHIYIGPPLTPDEFSGKDSDNREHQQQVADRCMGEIRKLIEEHRRSLSNN